MKGLATLIKLHKRTLDDLRRKLADLENQKSQLLLLSQRLKEELAEEIRMASGNPEMGQFFGNFSRRIQQRQADIAQEIAALDKQMDAVSLEIAEAFSELKKYEIALAAARRREAEKLRRKETILMDEIAANQHQRKQTAAATEDAG